ncbi:winged helix-turn-helix transcriptional regulator [Photobacterium sp. BZF1]|uniref:ArsR/SmtB family transcription factor n=1 Tax=Photobacterium sp. BZF1 TaxID=1904457 RepID=UPI001653E2F4|nr:metalloregulator ArsR/SmtB family transcription factor [Photobacterium sp. BZF1]MBC7003003.1 winged helix-turn-helix transcriptional regulator [Photobacterium sp. BZF1]
MADCLTNLDPIELDEATEKELAAFGKAISHPARVRLLRILASGQCLGTDLVDQLDLAQSTISEHLRVLKQAGLVHAEVQHPRTCFSLKPEAMARMKELIGYIA